MFELKSDDLGNLWALPSGKLPMYTNIWLLTYHPDVKENILSVTSAPSYIKDSQKLDEYNKK